MAMDKQQKALVKRDTFEEARIVKREADLIGREVLALLDLIDNADIDIHDPATGNRLRSLVAEYKDSVSAFIPLRDAFELAILVQKGKRDFHAELARCYEAAFERMKAVFAEDVIKTALETTGQKTIEGKFGRVGLKRSESVVFSWGEDGKVTDKQIEEFGIDAKYIETTITKKVAKAKVMADLKDLVEIPWAGIKEKLSPTGTQTTANRLEGGEND